MSLRSKQFDDIYFSAEDGPAETRHVFLEGNILPQAWQGKQHFTIVETGFGTGLNFLSTWRLFEQNVDTDQVLDYISFEKYPLSTCQIKETLSPWATEFEGRLDQLIAKYPLRIPGFHRVIFNNRIRLTLIFDDINDALPELTVPNGVNAWFLDGFAPAKNPEMWSDTLFREMNWLSAENATVATFTVAGDVRRGLQEAGFAVEKTPGFGRKREMLRGLYQNRKNYAASKPLPKTVAIIGGGLAGASCAYILKQQGFEPVIYEKSGISAIETSKNATAIYNPRISAHKTVESDFYVAAFARMFGTLENLEDVGLRKCGYVHLMTDDKKEGRFQETLDNWRWHEDHMKYLNAREASEVAGVKLERSALYLPDSGCLSLGKLYEAYLDGIEIRLNANVTALDDLEEDVAILACYGAVAGGLGALKWLPAHTVRGQGTLICKTEATKSLKTGLCYGGHITPAIDGVHAVGSTYQKWIKHTEIMDEDHDFNLARLRERVPSLAANDFQVTGGKAGLRTATNDRFPVVGPVPDRQAWKDGEETDIPNLYITLAHGSHGIVSTMAAAHILADTISERPYSLSASTATLLKPDRFLKRDKRKNRL